MCEGHPDLLIEEIQQIETQFIKTFPIEFNHLINNSTILKADRHLIEETHDFFKSKRTALQHDKSLNNIQKASLLFFIIQHGFNGLYCENGNGNIGTAFNWKKKQIFLNEIKEKIYGLHFVFNSFQTEFTCKHFRDLDWLQDTFFYLDPPYVDSDKNYIACGFSLDEQKKLLEIVQKSGAPFLYSNHDSEFLRELIHESVEIETWQRKNNVAGAGDVRDVNVPELLAYRQSAWPFRSDSSGWLELPLKSLQTD
jgi:site-specific DNA-adenine methylase